MPGTPEPPLKPDRIGGSRPVPDPTLLTTQQVLRENAALKELISTRLDAMDKAIVLLQQFADKSPTTAVLEERIAAIKELLTEKFEGIRTQFAERDIRAEQSARDSKVAVDAALQAAKEAVAETNKSSAAAITKSEAATTKQIDAIGNLIVTRDKGVDEKVDDVKTRLTAIESQKIVTDPSLTEALKAIAAMQRDSSSSEGRSRGGTEMRGLIIGGIIGGVGFLIAVLTLISMILKMGK